MASTTADQSAPSQLRLRDGTPVWWRFVVPADRAEFEAGFTQLSPRARYQRFHQHVTELPAQLWEGLEDHTGRRGHIALLLFDGAQPFGVCHVFRSADDWHTADVSVTIADHWQGRGAGSLLLREALAVAGDVHRIDTQVMLNNTPAIRLLESLGEIEFECVQGHCQAIVAIERSAAA